MVVDWGSKTLEYFFGSGIQCKPVGEAVPMEACEVLDFGTTTKTEADLIEYLRLASPRFTVTTYDVFSHNCNNFSDEVARFLTGQAVPERILNMANEALSTPRGKALRGLLEGFECCVDNTMNQHRHRFLKRCSKVFLRQKPEPSASDDSARDETPRRNPPAKTTRDRTSRGIPENGAETDAADATAAGTAQRHRPLTPSMPPDAPAPDAAPHTAAPDAGLDAGPDEMSPAARLRRGVDVSVIPDENKLAAFHAASSDAAAAATPAAAPAAALAATPAAAPVAAPAAAPAVAPAAAPEAGSTLPPNLKKDASWRSLVLAEVAPHGVDSEPAALMMDTLVEQERRRQEWIAYHLGAGEEAEARALGWNGDEEEEDAENIAAFFVGMVDSALMADADLAKALRIEQGISPAAVRIEQGSSPAGAGLQVPSRGLQVPSARGSSCRSETTVESREVEAVGRRRSWSPPEAEAVVLRRARSDGALELLVAEDEAAAKTSAAAAFSPPRSPKSRDADMAMARSGRAARSRLLMAASGGAPVVHAVDAEIATTPGGVDVAVAMAVAAPASKTASTAPSPSPSPPSNRHRSPSPSPPSPGDPRSRDVPPSPRPLAPLARRADDAPIVHVREGPNGVPLEIRVHLPNGFPGTLPEEADSYAHLPPRPFPGNLPEIPTTDEVAREDVRMGEGAVRSAAGWEASPRRLSSAYSFFGLSRRYRPADGVSAEYKI